MHAYCIFFNDTATTEIYTLSLHDALPISDQTAGAGRAGDRSVARSSDGTIRAGSRESHLPPRPGRSAPDRVNRLTRELRSEEHTSELQSQSNLVCRLLLEKKKQKLSP